MILVILTAVLAVSEAANIEKRYISLFNTRKSGGLFSPLGSIGIESPAVPSGSYTNDDLGVVVDAVAPGTRTSGVEPTGLGGPRTSYGSLDSKVGDAAFEVGGGAVLGTASGIGSLFGPSIGQEAHIGLPGIGFGSGSSSLDVVGEKPTGAQVTGFGVSKTTYESIHPTGEDVALGVENAAVKGGATGSGSILSSGSSQANLGLPGIGFGSGSSSLDVVGEKPTGAQVTGFGVSKTTYESIHPTGGDVALGVENAAVKGGATGSGSILSSGSSQANLGLPGIGFGSGSSSLDVAGEKPTGAQVTGFGVSKTTYESIHPTGGDVALGVKNAAIKGGATGSASILSSGSSQANLGLPGIGFGSGSSSSDVVGEKPTGAQVTGFGVSKTTYESIHPTGADVALGVENAAVKGGATGSGSILSSGSSKANLGLPGIGFGSGSSSLDVVGEKPTGTQGTGFGLSKTTYESIQYPTGGDVALGVKNAAVKGVATESGSILSSDSSQANLGLPGIGFGSRSSSLDVAGEKPTGAQVTGFGVSKTTYESIHPTGADVALGVENAAVKGGATGSGSILSSGSSKANLGLPFIGFGSGSSSLDVVGEKPTGAQGTGFGLSKTTYESIQYPTGGDVALGVKNAAVKGVATESGSILSSDSSQANLGLPGIGFGSRSSSLDVAGEKPTGAQVTGFGVSKTTYESIHPTGGNVALDVENVAVKGDASGSVSIFNSGLGQADLGLPSIGSGSGSNSLEASRIKATGAEITGLGKSRTSFESINSEGGEAALNIGNEKAEGGSAGLSSVFDTSSGQEAKIGLTGISVVPASSALDVSGKVTGSKVTGLGVSKTTYESIEIPSVGLVSGISSSGSVEEYEHDKIHAQKFADNVGLSTKGAASEIASAFGSSKQVETELPSFGLGSGVISSGIVEGYENDKSHAQKFANNAALSAKGDYSGVSSVLGSGLSQNANTGVPNIGVLPGCSSFEKSGVETSGAELTSFDLSKTSHSSIGSKDEDASIADASLKVSAAGVDSLFGSGIGQKENVELPGIGVLPKVSSSVVGVEGYKNDKSHEQKFELEGGIATHPHVETLTSQKQNAKEESVSHVLDGSYNVQNNNDKSDNAKCNGEEKTNLSINSGDSILKPNLVGQGSTVVQGSIGNGQSISTAGQSIENKFDGFGLNGQTETLNTPEFLYDVGKIGVTGGFQTAGSYGVNQEKTQHFGIHAEKHGESNVVNHQSSVSTSASTSSVGTPNPGQQVPGSTKCSDGSSATFGSGITNAFNTGNFNQAGQNSEDSKFGSYFLTSPFYPGYTVVDNRQKLSGYEGVKFSTNSSPLKAAPLVNFQGLHFPIKNSLNLDLNKPIISPQYRQHQGLTSSHYKVLTQTYVPSFTSAFLKPSTNFAQLSSNQGSFSSDGDQDSLSHKSTFLSDQKLLVHNQSNQKSSEFSVIPTQFGSMSGFKFLEKPLTIGIPTPTPAAFEKMPETKSISNIVPGSQNNQFGFPFSSINNAKSVTTHSSSSSYNSRSEGQSTQKYQSNVKSFDSPQSTGSRFAQIQFGNTFRSQSSLNSQKGIGLMSSTPSQVQHTTPKDEKSPESQPIHKSFQQLEYSSTFGSQFGNKPELTWKTSQTFPIVGQKPTVTSHSGSANVKAQFGFPSSSLNSAKPGSTQSISSSYSGGSKGQSVQSCQMRVKPFGSSQSTGFGSSHTQFGSTFESQSGLNLQKVVGSISSTTSQVQHGSQKEVKQSGSQDSNKNSQQSQYSSTSGSQFGKKSESTGTISEKLVTTHSSSSSNNGGTKEQSVQTSQSSVKPFGSSQIIGSGFSQTQIGSTFGSQSGLNSQKVVGSISSSISQVQQKSQNDAKQWGSQDSNKYSHQSQYSLTSGSQFGKKPELTATVSHTFPVVGQKKTGSDNEKTQFGSTFGSQSGLNSQKVVGSISSSISQVQQKSQNDAKQWGSQDSNKYSHQSQYSLTSGSQFGKKPELTATVSHTFPVVGQKKTGSDNENTQFGSTFGSQSSLNSQKVVGSIASSISQVQQNSQNNAKQWGSQDSHKYLQQSQYTSTSGSQFGKQPQLTATVSHTFPVVGQKKTGSDNEKTQFGSTFGSQSGLNLQKVVKSISSTTFQVQHGSQKDVKQSGSQDSNKNSHQSQYSSTSESQFGKKPESTGTISEKSVTTHSSSSSNNGGTKEQSVQTSQLSLKPFGSSQIIGSGFSQTQIGSTFGSQSGLNSQKVVGSISSSISQVQQKSQNASKQWGSQDSNKYSHQSQYSLTSGSQFGKKPELTATVSHTFPVVGQKKIGSDNEKTQFGSTFGSQSGLNSQKVVKSISSTTSQVQHGSQKDVNQSGSQNSNKNSQQSQYSSTSESQFGKKPESTATVSHTFPVVVQKKTGSDNEKTQFGSTFGSQSGLNSQKVVGSISSSISQVQQKSQNDAKQSGLQDTLKDSQQSQYNSTSGSQYGKKPESTGTISHIFPVVGQKTTVTTHTSSSNEKQPFGFTSSSLTSAKSVTTQSISSSYNGGSKGQSVQSSQSSVKPFGSSQRTGFGSSHTQFGSTFGSQSGLNSQKVVGSISSSISQVQQKSQNDAKQWGSQDSNKYSHQSQYSLTSGSQFGKKPELTATVSHTFPVVGQKKTGSDNEKTQFGSTFESQSGLNLQKVVKSISSTTSQVQHGSQKDVKQSGSQDSNKNSQQSQYSSTSESQFGKKPESTGTISEKSVTTHSSSSSNNGGTKEQSVQTSQLSLKPFGSSQIIGSGFSQIQIGSKFGSQSGLNSQKVVGSISSPTSQVQQKSQNASKQWGSQDSNKYSHQSQYSLTSGSQFGKKPELTATVSHTFPVVGQKKIGSDNEKTQFGSTFGSQSGLNSQKVVGSISSSISQVQQKSQNDAKQSGLQDTLKNSQQSQYNSTSGSQYGKKPESTGTISHIFPVVGQKTTATTHTSSSNEKQRFGFTSSSLTSAKSVTTQSISSSYNGGSKGQSVQSSQSSVKPFGSSQRTGFGSSHTQFGSTFGSQSGLNSQKVVGSISSSISQVQQKSQNDAKQWGSQDSNKYSHQSQYSLTSGSQFGKKPELTATVSHTFPVVGQKKTGSDNEKTQFGSTFGSQSSLNSQKVVGSIASSISQVQQNSQNNAKQWGSQDSHKYSQQSQYSSTSGSQFGKQPELTSTVSHTFPVVGQKKTGSDNEKTQFGSTFGSQSGLNLQKVVKSISSTTSQVQHGSQKDVNQSGSQNSNKNSQQSQYSSTSESQFGKKPESTATVSHTFPVVGQKKTGSDNEKTQFGSTFGSQSGLNSQKVVGSISSSISQVQQKSQNDAKQSGLQDTLKDSQQSQYNSTSGSQYGKKSESTGTISHIFPVVGQKTTVTTHTSSSNEKQPFGFTSSSLTSAKSVTTQSISSSYNGGSKGQSVQSSQSSVKPFGSSQRTGFGSSHTQFGSTFGSQSGLNSQKVVGSISSSISQVQQKSQNDAKQWGSQDSNKYSHQSQYSLTSGSQFGKKPELTATVSHTFPVVGQKKTGSDNEKTQFGSTFGSQSGLNLQKVVKSISSTTSQVQHGSQKDVKQSGSQDSNKNSQQSQYSSTSESQFGKKPESTGTISEKSVTTHSSSSSNNGGTKQQSVQTSQLSLKPFGSSQIIGSGFSQTQIGSTFGSQSGLNSQKVVGSISSSISQVQQKSQNDAKQWGSQDSNKYSQQSQYSSTSGSQFGKKPELTATVSHTFPVIGQKKTGSDNEKTLFGSTFGSQSGLNLQKVVGSISSTNSQVQHSFQKDVKQSGSQDSNKYSQQFQYSSTSGSQFGKKPASTGTISEKSVTTHSTSTSNNGGTKEQSVQTSQSSVKPFGSSQTIGSGFSQTQIGSTFGSQSGLNSQKVVGSISSPISQVQQKSQNDAKQWGSQDSNKYSQQSQYSSTSGSQLGKKPELTATISHTFPVVGQKETGSDNEKTQFGFSSSSLNSEKSGSTQRTSSSYNAKSKGQSVQSSQLNEKPISSSQSIGSDFPRTQLGSSFGTQSGHSQKLYGTINSISVQPISEYRKKPFGSQSDYNAYQQSQYSSTTGTEVKSGVRTAVGQKFLGTLQTGFGNENTQLSKSAGSLLIKKPQSTESNSFSVSSIWKDQAEQTGQLGSKSFVYPQTTGSSFSKIHLGSTFDSPYDKQSFGRHNGSYQDTLLGLVTGSQGLSGQKHTGSGSQQPHLSFSLRDLLNYKPQSTFSKSFSQSYTSQGNTANKPFDSIPTPLHRHSGVGIVQNHESAASTSASSGSFRNTKTKYQTTNFGTNGLQPFGGSLTQTVHKQTKVFELTPSTDLLSVAHSIFDQSVSKVANTVPGAEIPISVTEKSSELASFIGKGETFGGPRDPPSFDIKAGYHY